MRSISIYTRAQESGENIVCGARRAVPWRHGSTNQCVKRMSCDTHSQSLAHDKCGIITSHCYITQKVCKHVHLLSPRSRSFFSKNHCSTDSIGYPVQSSSSHRARSSTRGQAHRCQRSMSWRGAFISLWMLKALVNQYSVFFETMRCKTIEAKSPIQIQRAKLSSKVASSSHRAGSSTGRQVHRCQHRIW